MYRVVVVGAGFAGYRAARTLSAAVGKDVEIVVVNSTDYFLYLPLLPEVVAGVVEPRRIAVPITATLHGVRLVLATATEVDPDARCVRYVDAENRTGEIGYDRLILAAGSVNKLLPVPGVARYAHGFRGLPETLYLRDHMTRQIVLAAATDDAAERAARCTFVVVGAGYTGTEVAAAGQLYTRLLVRRDPRLRAHPPRWLLVDIADSVLPGLDPRLSRTAARVLRRRGVELRLETAVQEATSGGVRLSDGDFIPARSLIWCVGVQPDPLIESLGLPTEGGRLVVDEHLAVPGHPEIFACGDVAAVPDPARPGQATAMTAQHAWRQGKLAGRNVAATFGRGSPKPYHHHDLGFLVDLGGLKAAANPLGVPLSGPLARAVTRGYHLLSIPSNRARIAVDWTLDALLPRPSVQLGLVRSPDVPLDTASPELPAKLRTAIPPGPSGI